MGRYTIIHNCKFFMLRSTLQCIAIFIAFACSGGCASQPTDFIDTKSLAAKMSMIDCWPDISTNYPTANWAKLVILAKLIQKSDSESVCSTLREYQLGQAPDSLQEIRNDSKLYLLMRIVFDLPEHAPNNSNWSHFGSWLTVRTEYNADGTINRAWPLIWNRGNPYLVSGCRGIQGFTRYDAADEFLYFRRKCSFRKLE